MPSQPTETSIPIGDWTIGSLKAYHDMMISYERQVVDERDKRYEERWKAQEKASQRYQEVSNEFRGSLDDLSSKMATKLEVNTAVASLIDKIETQGKSISELRSRLDVGNPDVRTLQNNEATRTGQSQGSEITMSKIYAAIVVGVSLLGAIMLFVR